MEYKNASTLFLIIIIALVSACGPSEEEQARKEQARQDSLEQVRLQRMEQQRQDSLANVRADSLAASEKSKKDQMNVSFDENGRYAIQVEAWRSQKKAQSQVSKWENRGFNKAFVVQYGDKKIGDIWFRVRLGKLQSREAAKEIQERLQEKYQAKSWISRI